MIDLFSRDEANSGLFISNEDRVHSQSIVIKLICLAGTIFAKTEGVKMPKIPSDNPRVAVKREQRLLASSAERSSFTECKSSSNTY